MSGDYSKPKIVREVGGVFRDEYDRPIHNRACWLRRIVDHLTHPIVVIEVPHANGNGHNGAPRRGDNGHG